LESSLTNQTIPPYSSPKICLTPQASLPEGERKRKRMSYNEHLADIKERIEKEKKERKTEPLLGKDWQSGGDYDRWGVPLKLKDEFFFQGTSWEKFK
jgi:hypothetical protein